MTKHLKAESHPAIHTPSAAAELASGERDVSGAVALFSALLDQLAPHAPSPEAAGCWRGMMSDEEARLDGVTVSSDRVLAAAMSGYAALVPYLLEEPLPGYGPRRAHYALSLALAHARGYALFLDTEVRRAGASESKGVSVQEARVQRAHLAGLLTEATEGNPALQASIAKAARRGSKDPAQVSASLQGLTGVARQLMEQAAGQPGRTEALEDMGITEEAVARAEEAARALGAMRGAHEAERTTHRQESDELNTFDGRVWFELDALQRAADRARALGRKVPAVRLESLSRRRRSAAVGEVGGEPAPAPVPAPAPGG